MGKVLIQEETTKKPIELMGKEAGICWNSDTFNSEKNYKRGLECLQSGHLRVAEYPQVYMILEGYSARMIREFYTHIGGMPTRLQTSTRHIDYNDFEFITPLTVRKNVSADKIYQDTMTNISVVLKALQALGIPREDSSMLLPLGMTTKVVVRTNLRQLIDMSHTRLCNRAYWEIRDCMCDMQNELIKYSDEWALIVKKYFEPKCKYLGYCPESKPCGKRR